MTFLEDKTVVEVDKLRQDKVYHGTFYEIENDCVLREKLKFKFLDAIASQEETCVSRSVRVLF